MGKGQSFPCSCILREVADTAVGQYIQLELELGVKSSKLTRMGALLGMYLAVEPYEIFSNGPPTSKSP